MTSKGPSLLIVAPLHGVIDGHDVIADFTNPVGGIDEVFAQIFARDNHRPCHLH